MFSAASFKIAMDKAGKYDYTILMATAIGEAVMSLGFHFNWDRPACAWFRRFLPMSELFVAIETY
ncbi:MAG: hypothetical protein QOJ99_4881 [Bryobacterales bacterium]|nr:hypothetical protein [Bryobacterales bacterium]